MRSDNHASGPPVFFPDEEEPPGSPGKRFVPSG